MSELDGSRQWSLLGSMHMSPLPPLFMLAQGVEAALPIVAAIMKPEWAKQWQAPII